jgi:hypothetical protein
MAPTSWLLVDRERVHVDRASAGAVEVQRDLEPVGRHHQREVHVLGNVVQRDEEIGRGDVDVAGGAEGGAEERHVEDVDHPVAVQVRRGVVARRGIGRAGSEESHEEGFVAEVGDAVAVDVADGRLGAGNRGWEPRCEGDERRRDRTSGPVHHLPTRHAATVFERRMSAPTGLALEPER